ncbi:MAG: SUMF1/EgtB/PvdO family nonheme iron enzyme [Planctomycetes bacterium]|nr:SUMF1/EgtB/PvdO family nonheme iron enzyme [Planctomycetota bacterium]
MSPDRDPTGNPNEGASSDPLEGWVERFLAALTERPGLTPEEFAAQAPPEIREELIERCRAHQFLADMEAGRETDESDEAARKIGEFRILRELGRGTGGAVYLAWQPSLRRHVALKVLHAVHSEEDLGLLRFRREATSGAKLNHSGIVQVYARGAAGGEHYIAMEYVSGGSLAKDLERLRQQLGESSVNAKRLPEPQRKMIDIERSVRIVAEVADALAHAHGVGVVHRDVKPQNILLTADGHAKLSDFGLAKDHNEPSLTVEGRVAGTPYYMSPEQALAKSIQIDHRSDVFSLGVVLYELLTLHLPFEGGTMAEVLYAISFRPHRKLRDVNPRVPLDLELVCTKALEKAREDRYSSAAEFAEDLRRFLRHEAVRAKAPSLRRRAARWLGRNRRQAAIGAAALGALGVGGFALAKALEPDRRVRVTIRCELPGARVKAIPFDATKGRSLGAPMELGLAPANTRLEPGAYRFVVDVPGEGFAELTELLKDGEGARDFNAIIRNTASVVRSGMIRISSQPFTFGAESHPNSFLAKTIITLPEFWIDAAEVSNGDYKKFVAETGARRPMTLREDVLLDDRPVTGVTFHEAQEYARWAGKRLPTMHEWERVARSTDGRLWPWAPGTQPSGTCAPWLNGARADYATEDRLKEYERWTLPVGSCPELRSADGVSHLFGNVREWTESPHVLPTGAWLGELRVFKGGSWFDSPTGFRLDVSLAALADKGSVDVGFRCAKSAAP